MRKVLRPVVGSMENDKRSAGEGRVQAWGCMPAGRVMEGGLDMRLPSARLACAFGGMRISGGAARGVTLDVPKGDAVRPATDGMRQAVFSSLGARVNGARFVDLFAGSGAYGLEAFSRGAAGGLFVEQSAKAAVCIRRNIAAVAKSAGRAEAELGLLTGDALAWRPAVGAARPDLVFVDPPYPIIEEIAPRLFAGLAEALEGVADPLIVFELPGEIELAPAGWVCRKRLGKGVRQPTVAFFIRA